MGVKYIRRAALCRNKGPGPERQGAATAGPPTAGRLQGASPRGSRLGRVHDLKPRRHYAGVLRELRG